METLTLREVVDMIDKFLAKDGQVVIKEDGLANGKGVYICKDYREVFEAFAEIYGIERLDI